MAQRKEVTNILRYFNIQSKSFKEDANLTNVLKSTFHSDISQREFDALLKSIISIPEREGQLLNYLSRKVNFIADSGTHAQRENSNYLICLISNWYTTPDLALQTKIFNAYTSFATTLRLKQNDAQSAFEKLLLDLKAATFTQLDFEINQLKNFKDKGKFIFFQKLRQTLSASSYSVRSQRDDVGTKSFFSAFDNLAHELAKHDFRSWIVQIALATALDSMIILTHQESGLGFPIRIIPVQMINELKISLSLKGQDETKHHVNTETPTPKEKLKDDFYLKIRCLSTLLDGTRTIGYRLAS
jgi:hypothetical protein